MRIGLIPMAAKPFHSGHYYLIEKAAKENDSVKIFTTVKGRGVIKGDSMQVMWNNFIIPGLQAVFGGNKISVTFVSSPVRAVYEALQDGEENMNFDDFQTTFRVYSDATDTIRNYPEKNQQKYFPELKKAGNVIFPALEETVGFVRGMGAPDISGTAMRSAIARNDKTEFILGLPEFLREKGTEIFNIFK